MKKLFLLTISIPLFFCLHAQVKKEMILIGTTSNLTGNLGQLFDQGITNNAGIQFGTYETNLRSSLGRTKSTTKSTAFNISPVAGVAVTDNIIVGFSLGAFIQRNKEEGKEKEGFNLITFSSITRGYIKNKGKVLPYGEVTIGLTSFKNLEGDAENALLFGAKAGISIFLNNKVSLDVFGNWIRSKKEKELDGNLNITTKQSIFGVGIGLSMFLSPKEKKK